MKNDIYETWLYETWADLVRRNTIGGACNFSNAAIEFAKLVSDYERSECLHVVDIALLGSLLSTRDRVLKAIRARGQA